MKKVTLTRIATSIHHGTFGTFQYGDHTVDCLERPWLNNEKNVSCIPAGTYTCVKTLSYKFKKETYELLDVPGRTAIRIHSANTVDELEGCIALGLKLGTVLGSSRYNVGLFEKYMNGEKFELEIIDAFSQVP